MGDQCVQDETPLFASVSGDQRKGADLHTRQMIDVDPELLMFIELSEEIY